MAADNHVLGRGKVYFDKYATGTTNTTGEMYFGNTPEFKVSIDSQSLDHFSSDEGIKEKDDSVQLQVDRKGNLVTDNISPENLALLFLGVKSLQSQAATPVTAEVLATVAVADAWYQLGVTLANPSGVREVGTVTVTNSASTPVPWVLNTDYELDAVMGRIHILPGGGAVGMAVQANYTPAAKTRVRVISKGNTIEGALRFIAFNPAGTNVDYFMPRVKLTPNGDFDLKGDDWQKMAFNIEILKKGTLDAIYMDGRAYTP